MEDKNNLDGIINFESNGRTKTIEKKNPVGRPRQYSSPNAHVFTFNPEALRTEIVTLNQLEQNENIILWGLDNAEPTKILDAIANSPTATNCVGKIESLTQDQ